MFLPYGFLPPSRFDWVFPVVAVGAAIVMIVGMLVVIPLALHAQDREFEERAREWADNARIVRICRDGTRLYSYHGELVDGRKNKIAQSDPAKVCE